MSAGLASWVEGQLERSVEGLLRSISAVHLVQVRPGLGQRVVPRPGSVLASPVPAHYDPEPDYFFHWFRDAPLVMDALRQVPARLLAPATALGHLADFVQFNSELAGLRGCAAHTTHGPVQADHLQYLRSAEELAGVRDLAVWGDVRVNPDATLDVLRWARPQHDGPALRALCLLHWLPQVAALPAPRRPALTALLEADLAYLRARGALPGYDIWEEELGHHFHTRATAAAALRAGAVWLAARGGPAEATGAAAAALQRALEDHWLPEQGFIVARRPAAGEDPTRKLDMSVILAALATDPDAPFGARDPRVHATLEHLAQLFDGLYALNRQRPAGRAPALGRYAADRYFGGNPWYVTTLAAAELCYRAAAGAHAGSAREHRDRGDAWLQTVRACTPADGSLSEQFDRSSGEPRSARHLAWSYAAFITCAAARAAAKA